VAKGFVDSLPENVIMNLKWQIPMGLDFMDSDQKSKATVLYNRTYALT
jgi:hypothetical protein